jgi:hypothetical protein
LNTKINISTSRKERTKQNKNPEKKNGEQTKKGSHVNRTTASLKKKSSQMIPAE